MSLAGWIVRNVPGARLGAQYIADKINAGREVSFQPTYNHDNLATDHWLVTGDKFDAAYRSASAAGLTLAPDLRWRAHVVCWAAANGQKLGGSFVECGVARGFFSRVIIDTLDISVPFYLLDTFHGLDERYMTPAQLAGMIEWQKSEGRPGRYEDSYEQVVRTFADRPNVRIVRGAVPETLTEVPDEKIAYLSIDMNTAGPEIAAIEYFWPKMVRGAYVILDDYGWQGHDEQRLAFNEWSSKNNAPILSLPTGQGLIVKA